MSFTLVPTIWIGLVGIVTSACGGSGRAASTASISSATTTSPSDGCDSRVGKVIGPCQLLSSFGLNGCYGRAVVSVGTPHLVCHLEDPFVSVFVKGFVTNKSFNVSGQIFYPHTVCDFCTTFALEWLRAFAEVINNLFPQG